MFKKLQNWALAFSVLSLSVVSCNPIDSPIYGITLRDTKERFTIFTEGSVATDIVENEDGSERETYLNGESLIKSFSSDFIDVVKRICKTYHDTCHK